MKGVVRMSQNFGLSNSELSAVHNINSEQAAHNIALAYITTVAQNSKISTIPNDL